MPACGSSQASLCVSIAARQFQLLDEGRQFWPPLLEKSLCAVEIVFGERALARANLPAADVRTFGAEGAHEEEGRTSRLDDKSGGGRVALRLIPKIV